MSAGHSVLIVDSSEDSRQVLRTVLERRGMEIFEASGAEQGLALAGRHQPNVVVLDLEVKDVDSETIFRQFNSKSGGDHTSLVVLGEVRLCGSAARNSEFISKPYHYGPLVRKIEQLVKQARAAA